MNHKIKNLLTAALFTLCLSSKIFATGAGIQAGGNPGLLINENNIKVDKISASLVGTMRFASIPMAVGFGFEAGKFLSDFSYGFTGFADYYAVDLQLKNTWNLYSGFGATGSLLTSNFKDWTASAGARFFIGTNLLFWDNYLELYAQQNIVPTYVRPLKADKELKGSFMLNLPLEAGVRMHF